MYWKKQWHTSYTCIKNVDFCYSKVKRSFLPWKHTVMLFPLFWYLIGFLACNLIYSKLHHMCRLLRIGEHRALYGPYGHNLLKLVGLTIQCLWVFWKLILSRIKPIWGNVPLLKFWVKSRICYDTSSIDPVITAWPWRVLCPHVWMTYYKILKHLSHYVCTQLYTW